MRPKQFRNFLRSNGMSWNESALSLLLRILLEICDTFHCCKTDHVFFHYVWWATIRFLSNKCNNFWTCNCRHFIIGAITYLLFCPFRSLSTQIRQRPQTILVVMQSTSARQLEATQKLFLKFCRLRMRISWKPSRKALIGQTVNQYQGHKGYCLVVDYWPGCVAYFKGFLNNRRECSALMK